MQIHCKQGAMLFQWLRSNQIDGPEHPIVFTPFLFYSSPSCHFSRPSCYPIAPPVPFPPPKKLLFSPHQMVTKKEPLSQLVLLHSYLLIGKQSGGNNRYWLPQWVKLLGRTSGGVRKEGVLRPPLPLCCQNSLYRHSTYPIPFHPCHWPTPPPLSASPHLAFFLVLPRWLSPLSHRLMPIFISACEMYS